ncbi:peptidoglycan DD-metalloendopeptidase family protein [Pseudarthrobacter sp. MDT3-26]|uniref:M23 family metallopeptidase n=1 Tax=Pseudarthrobacter raffinosi TaxID=2953651 RepID=UPI00208E270C|nr:peptidoglycan DD-metalloendopeptidase family protein [Pseudarthrobacter sp. MDT3-26]MCO4262859.1 peptidoglycan DD-metalloendopeptidase family protein [Pseudarthrobacter sp. MDT3-26]
MGNHRGSGREKEPAGGCAIAVRVLAASAVAAASLIAVGLPGSSPVEPRPAASPAAAGHVGLPGLAGAFLTDSRALVPFNRTLVRTIAKGGSAPLNVAAAGLTRPREGSLMAPLELLTSSSPFGYRVSPITGAGGDFHLGQDFAAGCGTRVYSADAGVVRAAGWHPWGGGNRVELDHGNGLITTYNHLEAVAVRTGDSVQVGQVIARVGTTGWSTGCHLHFETILNGKHTSPLNWTLLRIRQLDELEDIAMVSYAKPVDVGAQRWAIPVAEDNSHTVLGGEEELSEPPPVEGSVTTSGPPDEAPTEEPSSDATSPESASPDPTATETATESSTETAASTASPSSTPSTPRATRTPTGTSSATPTTTSPTPTGTSPAPTGTSPAPTTSASPSPTPTVSRSWPFRPTSRLTPTPAPTVEPTATTSSGSSAETASPSPSSSTTATSTATPTDTATWSESAGP